MSKRTVNRPLLDSWIDSHSPDAIARLGLKANVSSSLLQKMRSQGRAPTKFITQKAICDAIGCDIEDLFPKVRVS